MHKRIPQIPNDHITCIHQTELEIRIRNWSAIFICGLAIIGVLIRNVKRAKLVPLQLLLARLLSIVFAIRGRLGGHWEQNRGALGGTWPPQIL